MKLEQTTTARGFIKMAFLDRYGASCSLQASSSGGSAIWLGCDSETFDQHGTPCGARMHLTQEMVATLLPILSHFVETGELERPVPPQPAAPTIEDTIAESARKAFAWYESLTPAEREAHDKAQRESWARSCVTTARTERTPAEGAPATIEQSSIVPTVKDSLQAAVYLAERAVIDAAIVWREMRHGGLTSQALMSAVDRLIAAQAAAGKE